MPPPVLLLPPPRLLQLLLLLLLRGRILPRWERGGVSTWVVVKLRLVVVVVLLLLVLGLLWGLVVCIEGGIAVYASRLRLPLELACTVRF